jgi:ATP-dependent exoDNAse (exonuclease V) beta subunit
VSLPSLELIPAGAGSGKTYRLQKALGKWILAGEVAPDRIMAVTFTEAAAAELKDRISAELIETGRLEDALRLDEAYISTIHGFGLRILTEFAFEVGASPQPRLIDDHEKAALTRIAMTQTDMVDHIAENPERFGYAYSFYTGETPEEGLRNDVLRIIDRLREIGWRPGHTLDVPRVLEQIRTRYGAVEEGDQLTALMRKHATALLNAFPQSLDREFPDNKAARTQLTKDFQNYHAARDWRGQDVDWKAWQQLRQLRLSKGGAPLPEGYDELAMKVKDLADRLPVHPGPLEQACEHICALLGAGQAVLSEYERAKQEAGLLDYSDMIVQAGQLLRDRPDVLKTLVERIDCLVIDEFQDTNPAQFALLWQLKEAGVPTMIVGDLKQAIMGFQGADPRLFEALLEQHKELSQPLTSNWRSQPALVEFVNALGPKLFGGAYVALRPEKGPGLQDALEFIRYPAKARKDQDGVRASALAQRVVELLSDPGQQVVDRYSSQQRGLRGGDIAVLCPTHNMLARYAEVFRTHGLRVRLPADGWFESRPVQIAFHALAYLANPSDRHAALYLAVTELGGLTLEEGLDQLLTHGGVEDPVLQALDRLAPGIVDRTIYALVADVLDALGMFDQVAMWPEADQARANLVRLLAEAAEFMDANREALAYGGFHGSGIQTFLAWLVAKVDLKDEDEQPEPRVLDEDAIVLSTWHSAKGREWPVVAVCGLDRDIKARVPSIDITYDRFDDLAHLLEHARIEYSPLFACPEATERFAALRQPDAELEARRLLYVALTRPRDKLILEWPVYKGGKETVSYWSILATDCRLTLGEQELEVGGLTLPCVVHDGGTESAETLDLAADAEMELLPIGRRAIAPNVVPASKTPDSRTPSSAVSDPAIGSRGELQTHGYGELLEFGSALQGADLGTWLHRCFETLGPRPDLMDRVASTAGGDIDYTLLDQVGRAIQSFESWLKTGLQAKRILREWPVLGMASDGAVISGLADLVVETPDGVWVIDHKSDRVTDTAAAFHTYLAQLDCYAAILEAAGQPVAGVGINWIRRGEVMLLHGA